MERHLYIQPPFFSKRQNVIDLEKPFTDEQREFVTRYADGQKFSMKELESIPKKFWAKDGMGLNLKAISLRGFCQMGIM